MKIAIVDDLPVERAEIIQLIETYFLNRYETYGIHPEFCEFDSGEAFLAGFEPHSYTLVILDIYMNELTGIETAQKLFYLDKQCRVIFFTSSTDHLLDGYGVHALSYVLKPIGQHQNALIQALDYYMDLLDIDNKGLSIKTPEGERYLLYRNIVYIESSVRNLCFHLPSEVLKVQGSYAEYAQILLQDERFLESYRNLTVNMDYVSRPFEMDFLLKTGEKVPISRRKKSDVLEKYTQYFINRRGY